MGLVPVVTALAALSGCSGSPAPTTAASGPHSSSSPPPPRLGGTIPTPSALPSTPMDDLEQPIARRLSKEIAGQGLTMQYLACPAWDHKVPDRLACTGYVDGLPADVEVRLVATAGGAVSFDARLSGGVVATRNLVTTLRRHGYRDVDCGGVHAYPADVGSRVVCRVHRAGATRYVVATVTSSSGRVRIRSY